MNSIEFKPIFENKEKIEFSKFNTDDKEIKIIINKFKFMLNEMTLLKKLLNQYSFSNRNQISIILKWLQVLKYLKKNANDFRKNNFMICGLKKNLMKNIFDDLMKQNSGIFVVVLKKWIDNNSVSLCTGNEKIKPSLN